MANLSKKEIEMFRGLTAKVRDMTATSKELEKFVSLVHKDGESAAQNIYFFLYKAGFDNLEDFSNHIKEKRSEEVVEAMVSIGLGIIMGNALVKILEK